MLFTLCYFFLSISENGALCMSLFMSCMYLSIYIHVYIYIKTDIVILHIEGSHVLLNISVNVVSCQKNICKFCSPTPR